MSRGPGRAGPLIHGPQLRALPGAVARSSRLVPGSTGWRVPDWTLLGAPTVSFAASNLPESILPTQGGNRCVQGSWKVAEWLRIRKVFMPDVRMAGSVCWLGRTEWAV